jgi:hypothetical protein
VAESHASLLPERSIEFRFAFISLDNLDVKAEASARSGLQ